MVPFVFPRLQKPQLFSLAQELFSREFDQTLKLIGSAPHFLPPSVAYAFCLLASDDIEEHTRAESILETVLSAQDLDPDSPDFGHFRMLFEDPCIADLNAVQLVLIELIPLAQTYHATLSVALRDALTESIRAGMAALENIDAHLTYSNVAVLDVANRILGGTFIADTAPVARGCAKLDDFITYTNRHGGFRDFNSPSYLGQMITTLATLSTFTTDNLIRQKADLLRERVWLQALIHYHPLLAQFAGPYSRAYPPDVTGDTGAMKALLYVFLEDDRLLGEGTGIERIGAHNAFHLATREHEIPAYLLSLLTDRPFPYSVREGADRDFNIDLTTYFAPAHALGTASIGFGSQARNLIAHAPSRTGSTPKIVYTRFLADGEPRDLNTQNPQMTEWGLFAGFQHQNRAIGLYGMPSEYRQIKTLRTEIVLLGIEKQDSIWCQNRPLKSGDQLAAEQWLFVDLGAVYVALYPLVPTHLGGNRDHPVSIHRENNTFRIDIVNYEGPAKYFWKYMSLPWEYRAHAIGPFFNGNLRAGMLIETADAETWSDFAAFRQAVDTTTITDSVDERIRRVKMARDDFSLELSIDLNNFQIVDRQVNNAPFAPVFLDAPNVVQCREFPISLDNLTVSSSVSGPWIAQTTDGVIVVNPTLEPATISIGDHTITTSALTHTTLDPY